MAQGCRGVYLAGIQDLRQLRLACRDALRASGFSYAPLRVQPNRMRVEGRQGQGLWAFLVRLLPLSELLGRGASIRAQLDARVVDDALRLFVQVMPWGEVFDESESFFVGQSLPEYIGDNRRAAKLFDDLTAELERQGAIQRMLKETRTEVGLGGGTRVTRRGPDAGRGP